MSFTDEQDEKLKRVPDKSMIDFSELGISSKVDGKITCRECEMDVRWIRKPDGCDHATYCQLSGCLLTLSRFLAQVRNMRQSSAGHHHILKVH
jgi:hypothetical protein